jgi:hypothetical protein
MLIYVVINVIWGLRVYDESQTHISAACNLCVYKSGKNGQSSSVSLGRIRDPIIVGSY